MQWTEEAIGQVFTMAGEGTSMSDIARHLGCSRCAVIGVYLRERLKRGTLPPVTPRKRILVPETRRDSNPYRDTVDKGGGGRLMPMPTLPEEGIGFVLPAMDPAPEPAPEARAWPAIGILDVTGCRWPVDADPAIIGRHSFCNAACQEGQSYCPEHRRVNRASDSRTQINETIRTTVKLVCMPKARAA